MLARSRPSNDVDDPKSWDRFRMLWPHLEVSGAIESPDDTVRQLMIDRVRYVWLRGGLPQALELGKQVDEAWTDMMATMPDQQQRAILRRQQLHLRFNIANVHRDLAEFEAARSLDQDTYREQAQTLGAQHAHTLMTAGGLAADLRGLGRYAEALARDRQTHPAWVEAFGEDYSRTLGALNNLASSERLVGNYRLARDLDQTAWDKFRVALGEEFPTTLNAASNLGRDMRDAGDYERSVLHLQRVLHLYETEVDKGGPATRSTYNTQVNLGVSLRSAGRPQEASEFLELAYERLNNSLGEASPHTLGARLSRAMNFLSLGDVARAQREMDAVHQKYAQSLGALHPLTLASLNNRAVVARAARQYGEARKRAVEAAEQFTTVLGDDHPHTLAARTNHAITTAEDGDPETALPILQDTVARQDRVIGPDHPDSLRAQANLQILLSALGRRGDRSEREIVQQLVDRIGDKHPAVAALQRRTYLHRVIDPHPF